MSAESDGALIVSVHQESGKPGVRISVRWQGSHEISDFHFEHLGDLLGCESETAHSGWAVLEPHHEIKTGEVVPLRR
jgi:hypothetical protein